MDKDTQAIVQDINRIVQVQEWFDFQVVEYVIDRLVIRGGADLTYGHSLELVFEEVFFYSGVITGWHTDTRKPMITTPEGNELIELNMRFEVQAGYQLFVIHPEDFKSKIYVAAMRLTFNTDAVYYYQRENLKQNERIAGFVKK